MSNFPTGILREFEELENSSILSIPYVQFFVLYYGKTSKKVRDFSFSLVLPF
jgi:hypothetical protein